MNSRRRPNWSARRPAGSISTVLATMYARITHTSVSSDVPSPRSTSGSAMSSVPLFTVARNIPRLVTDRTHQA